MRDILTKRENEIFVLLAQKLQTGQIAEELGISDKTVRNHISNVIQKLGVSNRTDAILELIKLHIIKI